MPNRKMPEVNDLSEVPDFTSDDEAAAFWDTHEMGPRWFDNVGELPDDPNLPPPRTRTRPVSVRFDDDVINRLQAVAARKNKGYQTLLKEFVAERLYEEEKRLGIVGS